MAKKTGTTVAISKKEETALALNQGDWGSENMDVKDMIVPKILLMQPMSKQVTAGNATFGSFIDSLDVKKVIGNFDKPFEMVPFGSFKTWVELHDNEFDSVFPYTPENQDLKLEEVVGETVITRNIVLNFYVLLISDLAKQEGFPYVLSLQRTSYKAGKKLVSFAQKLKAFQKPIAAKVFTISASKQTNEKNQTWGVVDVSMGRDTTKEEITEAKRWYDVLAKVQVKVDHSDIQEEHSTMDAEPEIKPANQRQAKTVETELNV